MILTLSQSTGRKSRPLVRELLFAVRRENLRKKRPPSLTTTATSPCHFSAKQARQEVPQQETLRRRRQWQQQVQQTRRFHSFEEEHSNSKSISTERLDPPNGQLMLDFFGEPTTFLGVNKEKDKVDNAMAALDGFLLAAVSKGRTCWQGGDESGIDIQSAHGVAVSWSEALRFATFWNQQPAERNNGKDNEDTRSRVKSAPMLAVVTVAPLLAHAGLSYTKHLDSLLKQTKPMAPGLPPVQLLDLAQNAVERVEEPLLNERERMHLKVLQLLLKDEHKLALVYTLRILRQCPGDAFALSLAMDLAHTTGDRDAAAHAAGTVVSYWHERRGGLVRPAIPGHAMALSYIALGFAVGGNVAQAEPMVEGAMAQGSKVCGAVGTWAKAHIYDDGGRVAEGISATANFDGIALYEGAGLLFFDCRLGGLGCRFSLDREERGRGKSASLRLFGRHFERVLEYSGFATRQPWSQPVFKSPLSWSSHQMLEEGDDGDTQKDGSFLDRLLGKASKKKEEEMKEHFELVMNQSNLPSRNVENFEPTCEDVLTWLPPTPILLSDATLVLFRMTLNGTVSTKNTRWDSIRNAWESQMDLQRRHCGDQPMDFCPLVSLAASILLPPSETGADKIGSGSLARGLRRMGQLLKLGNPQDISSKKKRDSDKDDESDDEEDETYAVRELVAETDPSFWYPDTDDKENEWRKAVVDLVSALDGIDPDEASDNSEQANQDVDRLRYDGWVFDSRPILEHAIVYCACKAGDIESLSVARSICSRGVTLRPVSPEEWWRYSIVLGLLGDQVASDNAWTTSINVGGGQGARRHG